MANPFLGYALGLSTGAGMQELTEHLPYIPPPYPVDYQQYSSIAGMNGVGEPIEVGPANLTWKWEFMTLAQYDFFLGVCSGASVPVFVKSRIEGGATLQFAQFSAIMWRPKSGVRSGPYRANVEIRFTNLVRFP